MAFKQPKAVTAIRSERTRLLNVIRAAQAAETALYAAETAHLEANTVIAEFADTAK